MLGVLLALPGIARDFTYEYEGQTLTYTVIDETAKTCQTKSGNNKSGALVIPAVAKDGEIEYSVTEIGPSTFAHNSSLTSVTIPNSVTKIGGDAFDRCYGLTSVTIGNSVTEIGFRAFRGCSGLTSVTIPNSVTAIGDIAFTGCSGLTSVTIGNSVIVIGEGVFDDCSGMTSVTIPNSVTRIGYSAFRGCSSLTSVNIPNSVTEIGSSAFQGCSGLVSAIIGNSVTTIGSSAFQGCSGLASVTIPNSVTEIGYKVFEDCSRLTDLTIEDSGEKLHFGENVFSNAGLRNVYLGRNFDYDGQYTSSGPFYGSGITELTISPNVTTFYPGAFQGCKSIRTVEIPNSVTSIANATFLNCSGLTSIVIPNSVTAIGNRAFNGCSGLTSAIIGNSVTAIGDEAFKDCSGLTSIVIPKSVTEIGSNTFDGCSGMKKVAFPSELSNPFNYAISITYPREGAIIEDGFVFGPEKKNIYFAPLSLEGEYVIPESVTSVGVRSFLDCSKLTSVTIPNSVTEINAYAFDNCTALKELRIDDCTKSLLCESFIFRNSPFETVYIGRDLSDWQFSGEKDLINLTIGNFVTTIGSYAFTNSSRLTSVNIPNSVITIGKYAFSGCSKLTSVTIPNSVTKIGESAFKDCSGLTSVTIPNSVTEIGYSAFFGCDGLKKSAYPSGLKTPISDGIVIEYPRTGAIIEEGFVYGPEKNTIYFAPLSFEGEYVIPESVSEIGENAFYGCSALTAVKATAMNPPLMNDNSFQGLYAKAALSVPADAATDYITTNWSLFENLRIGDSEATGQTYETGNLKYMLIPAKTKEDKNLAVVIPGNYSSLTEVTIPERFTVSENGTNVRYHVDGIGYKAFNGCTKLATVTFNSRNASKIIGDYAFAGTNISAFSIPETVEAIGNHAFDGCKSLASIVIPGSVETIGDYAFNNTNKLNAITLNEGLKSIGENAFSATQQRNSGVLNIPSTLQSIGTNAFQNFKCEYAQISDLSAWCKIDFGNKKSNPANGTSLYLNGEKIEDLVIPESVDAISGYAFYDNKALKSVKFHDTLQSIGDEAFYDCSLWDITIPGNVTYIGKSVFSNVRYLTLAYSQNPLVVGAYGFSDPISLSLDRPIGDLRFSTYRLESLTIGNSVTEIPAAKFKGASKLTSLVLGNSLTAIGDEAFSGCTDLTEVILPPSVETIGASAFAGNSKLTSIIMGHNVKTIGEKAYDLCPAQTVSITAQTPPTAHDNTFSNYTGKLYVQGQEAAKAYYDADYCWYQFEGHVMIEPSEFKVEGNKVLSGKPGDTFQLKATLYPTDVTLPHVFWRSTNPEIATVDANGLVTLHADMSEIMTLAEGDDASYRSCKIIAESLYANGPVAEFMVNNDNSGIDDIVYDSKTSGDIDFTAPMEVYNLQGVMVSDNVENLANGIYIVRQGKNVKKIAVK